MKVEQVAHRHHLKIVGRTSPMTGKTYSNSLFFQCDIAPCKRLFVRKVDPR